MKKIVLCLAVLVLAGCATKPTYWFYPPGRNAADFEREKVQCYYQAKAQAATTPIRGYQTEIGVALAREQLAGQLAEYCLLGLGYTKRA